MKKTTLILCLFLSMGCAAKANKTETTVTLSCVGSCEVEFPDGTKMKKGIITFPSVPPVRISP